ncbi:hypothetical protein [Streptomyces sp. NBC_01304]|uniref:hypothetical protein n=1 Tax=Streptomyces sp. NBC_01304 TaxID=2903818 RepID=UPI002E136CEE|nr:hypothetical protein OG430_48415 [Streptomyces sp. NBC_01304]
MSAALVPHDGPAPAAWVPPAVLEPIPARQPPQSAGRGFRVLRALISLGPGGEHQLAAIAAAAELQAPHTAKLLKAAVLQDLVQYGSRRGTYRLAPECAPLQVPRPDTASTPRIRDVLQLLQQETGLAVAWHEPHHQLGRGLRLDLVDLLCPADELAAAAAQQDPDVRHSAAGRIALAYLPPGLTVDAKDRPLVLPDATRTAVRSSRIAVRRSHGTCTLSSPVMSGTSLLAVLSVTGPARLFEDPLRAQEFAVLIRRAATRVGARPYEASRAPTASAA